MLRDWGEAHSNTIHSMWFSDDYKRYFTIAKDNLVKEWDLMANKYTTCLGEISENNIFKYTDL
jgi:WD40 repeat protein